MAQKQQINRPQVQYRVELEKKIDINKSYSERRNQAIAMRILSYGLFGQKRYQNLYLTCSLNCFYYALKIANAIHRRVAGLAMIIRFETAHVIQYYSEPFEGKTFGQKNTRRLDKKQAGYNPGLNADVIEQPLTQVIARKQRPQGQRFQRGRFQRGRGVGRGRGGYRGRYNNNREQHRDRPYHRDDRDNRNYRDNRDRRDDKRDDRRDDRRDERRDDRQENRTDYRKFRTSKDQHPQEDNNRRGQRRTRGTNNNYSRNDRNNQRDNQDRTYNRRRYQTKQNRGEERGERGPKRRYNRDDDEQ